MNNDPVDKKSLNEILHGEKLARSNAEAVWGWNSPAGIRRASRRASLIAQKASLGPGKTVLEVGCGTGLFTEIFSRTGASIIAVDISPHLLAKARARNLPESRVKFLEKRFEDCVLDGPFDAVIGSSILHHLNIDTALENIYNLLKPGGTMSFAEPNMLNPQIMVQKNVPWIKRLLGDSPDETAFFRWQMVSLLKKFHFESIDVHPFDWLHPATPLPLIKPVSQVGVLLEKIPLVSQFAGSLTIKACRPTG